MDAKERAEVEAYYERATVCANLLPPPGDVEMTKAAWMILGLLADSERAERYRLALKQISEDGPADSGGAELHFGTIARDALKEPT